MYASNCSTLTCLRSLSEEALTNAIDASYEIGYAQGLYAYGYFYYGPAVDGRIIQDLPSQELEAGNLAKLATAFSDAGLPVYKMMFKAGTQIHGASAAFLNSPAPQTQDPELAAKMQDYWISFVKTMGPNGGKNNSSGVQR
ncbi:hypothetical protein D6D23_05100 [Aureobasidium pullulans]|nr:hypothetical protein D6D23_05100 [Aureobasidium pullulans]THZ99327.1 hypothetical protein D6C82_05224 [Aureobasidium pullulans]